MKYDKKRIDEFFEITYEKYKDELEPFFKGLDNSLLIQSKLPIPEEKTEQIKEQTEELEKYVKMSKEAILLAFLMRDEEILNGHTPKDIKEYVKEFISNSPMLFGQPASIKTHIPKNLVMPNHKVMASLPVMGADGEFDINLAKIIPKDPDIKTRVSLSFDFDEKVDLPKNYTQYDRAVFNAICSIYEEGTTHFTPSMVYRVMTGKTKDLKITPQTISAVTRSIEKQRKSTVKIDGTAELKKRKIENAEELTFDSNILNLDKVTAVVNGAKTECYCFLRSPMLYDYCKCTRQIITVPLKLLDTKSVRNTSDIIVIKEYLLRQIELIKKGYRNNSKMLYDTVFKECGISITDRSVTKRYRGYIEKLLQEWVEMKHIKAYNEHKQGNKVVGIEVKT